MVSYCQIKQQKLMNLQKHSHTNSIRLASIDHSIDLIKSKINYEMNNPNYIGPSTEQDYISKCLFALTVSTPPSRAWAPLYKAQENARSSFSALYAKELRLWGIRNKKLNKRNANLQPLVMTFFDVEGSRHSQGGKGATMPHYHGIVLLHHDTVEEFLQHLTRNELDRSYSKSKPTYDFSSIHLQPLPSYNDARRFLEYSTKYSKIIDDYRINHSHSIILPEESKYFSFFEHHRIVK
ncbi:hypothetical protein J2X76_004768 [Neorhizobium sp. 2083]|uniref:hypothetical protein n=1 Tax=Neorhizobium sp. 2083 TaxID=2817762 RepID=UPI002855584E|nr:hypothetical protein [Neorhizobium sp. 2083]MDR6819576.1 hypothetical protein [Neorhizobium sp. 2083]